MRWWTSAGQGGQTLPNARLRYGDSMTHTSIWNTIQNPNKFTAEVFTTLCRVASGIIFTLEGTQKLFGWWSGSPAGSGHPERFLSWPYWWAGPPELILGILLTLGLFTRISAFLGAGMMAYAYLFTHLPEGVTPVEKHGGAYSVVYCTTFLLLYIQPSTRLSLDYLLKQRMTPAA